MSALVEEFTHVSFGKSSENESEGLSDASDVSFPSAIYNFLPYEENFEPIATEEETAQVMA